MGAVEGYKDINGFSNLGQNNNEVWLYISGVSYTGNGDDLKIVPEDPSCREGLFKIITSSSFRPSFPPNPRLSYVSKRRVLSERYVLFFFFGGAFPTRGSIGTLTRLQSHCALGVPRDLNLRVDKNIHPNHCEEMHLRTECGAQPISARGDGLTYSLLPRLTPTH
ncbi:hypothetical protein L208DRAFT_71323 [Tricholoma matsutake]|nr:hypothetical protein L208DRAFT_71323 [Tricholoma matsutake 945]